MTTTEPTPLVRVTAHCANCARTEHLPPTYDHEEAKDMLSTLGWFYVDTAPTCPTCADGAA